MQLDDAYALGLYDAPRSCRAIKGIATAATMISSSTHQGRTASMTSPSMIPLIVNQGPRLRRRRAGYSAAPMTAT